MDIISMQIANKVLKRMNTEFNGLYDLYIATGGQKVFRTTKPHDITNRSLHVYVNGFHAAEETDYIHKDQYDIEFKTGLKRGDIVLLTTQVVGVPKFEVINPAYDDSTIKAEIVQLTNRIQAVVTALDENGDGSIIDTIGNLKKMWEDADQDLVKLVELQATKAELQALAERVEEVAGSIPPNDTELAGKVSKLETSMTAMERRVKDLEDNTSAKDLFIADDKTGRKHKLHLTDGTISAKLVGAPMEVTHTAPQSVILDVATEFRLNVIANADLNQKVKLVVSHNDKVKLEYNDGSQWAPFVSKTIDSLTNLGYSLRITGVELGTHEVRIDLLKHDNNIQLGTTTFSVIINEPPSSIISGTVELNGADHEKVLVQLQKDGDENVIAVGMLEDGNFNHKTYEAGNYTLSVVNGTDTHTVEGETEIALVVELGQSYAGNNFVLKAIPKPPTETERVVALLEDTTTTQITISEDITLNDFVLGADKEITVDGVAIILDGATDVSTFKITTVGTGTITFNSNFTLTGDGNEGVVIDNSAATVSFEMGTLTELPTGYIWEGHIFKKEETITEPGPEEGVN